MDNPPITNNSFNFTSDYELRIYTSVCYYFDKDHRSKSDELTVAPLRNLDQTQCFSTHLTTFAVALQILSKSSNSEYNFANADFIQNKKNYLTIKSVFLIYTRSHSFAMRQ